MTSLRWMAPLAVVGLVASGCTSSGKDGGHSSTSTGSTPPATACAAKDAVKARQTLIDAAGFHPACVSVKVKAQFFFVNNDAKGAHKIASAKSDPEQFTVSLPKKRFAYEHTFHKKGRYDVTDPTTHHTMTVFVS